MWSDWFATDWTTVTGVIVTTSVIYALIVIYTRLAGLRSLSKMTAPDFAMTVAVGSLFGSVIATPSPTLLTAAVAFGMLFLGQAGYAKLRRSSIDTTGLTNQPRLLAYNGAFLHDAMEKCLVTEDDIRGKLREANALSLKSVKAVVFESTGDVSVLHGEGPVDDWLMANVVGWQEASKGQLPAN